MDAYLTANQALWDAWTPFHVASKFYDVDGLKAGDKTLDPIVLAVTGDVRGKSLLHLQCHFGLDTLRWARRGATVTGADFSREAIQAARTLASELGLAATFVHSNLYDLHRHLEGHGGPAPHVLPPRRQRRQELTMPNSQCRIWGVENTPRRTGRTGAAQSDRDSRRRDKR